MDPLYLRSFVIATAAPALTPHFGFLALQAPERFTPDFHLYSFVAPLYFGAMGTLSLYLGRRYNWSLKQRLFYTSLLSITIVQSLAYGIMRHRAEPYRSFSSMSWLGYHLRNATRHLVIFNVWMRFAETYWDRSPALRIFTLGSSALFYLYTFWQVGRLERAGHVRYSYRLFAATEPWIQGLGILAYIWAGTRLLHLSLPLSLLVWALVGTLSWYVLARQLGSYSYTPTEWRSTLFRVVVTRLVKAWVFLRLLRFLQN